jgi:AAA family ATPase
MSSKSFVISLADQNEAEVRAVRRVVVNAEVLKALKLCSGDIVALMGTEDLTKVTASRINNSTCTKSPALQTFAVGVVWPSLEISAEGEHHKLSNERALLIEFRGVSVPSSLLLTAGLAEGSKAQIYPLTGKRPAGIPSQFIEAAVIRLREVSRNNAPTMKDQKDQKRDWLVLLLKESLGWFHSASCSPHKLNCCIESVDLKYITNFQTLEVFYEGRIRRFTVISVSAQQPNSGTPESLTDGMQKISVDPPAQLWIVGWETSVMVENQEKTQPTAKVLIKII